MVSFVGRMDKNLSYRVPTKLGALGFSPAISPWAESKVIGQDSAIIRRGWKQSQVVRFAEFSGAKWPILRESIEVRQPGMFFCSNRDSISLSLLDVFSKSSRNTASVLA